MALAESPQGCSSRFGEIRDAATNYAATAAAMTPNKLTPAPTRSTDGAQVLQR